MSPGQISKSWSERLKGWYLPASPMYNYDIQHFCKGYYSLGFTRQYFIYKVFSASSKSSQFWIFLSFLSMFLSLTFFECSNAKNIVLIGYHCMYHCSNFHDHNIGSWKDLQIARDPKSLLSADQYWSKLCNWSKIRINKDQWRSMPINSSHV